MGLKGLSRAMALEFSACAQCTGFRLGLKAVGRDSGRVAQDVQYFVDSYRTVLKTASQG